MRSSSLVGLLLALSAFAQDPNATEQKALLKKLPLKADLVLSPEFCATKKRQSIAIKDVLNLGKFACPKLEEVLDAVFSNLTRVETAPVSGTSASQVVVIPRFLNVHTNEPMVPSSQRKVVILLEWTIQDTAGRTIWLQTVQGSSEHKAGWMITKKGMDQLADAAISDLAAESAARMSLARELQNLSK